MLKTLDGIVNQVSSADTDILVRVVVREPGTPPQPFPMAEATIMFRVPKTADNLSDFALDNNVTVTVAKKA